MKRRVALSGAAVAVGAGVVAYRRRRAVVRSAAVACVPQRAASTAQRRWRQWITLTIVAPLLLARVLLAWPWDPIINAGGSAINQIKDWVKGALDVLWRALADSFFWMLDQVTQLANTVSSFILAVGRQLGALTNAVVQLAIHVTQVAADTFNAAVSVARNLVDSAFNAARGLIYDVLIAAARGIDQLRQWVIDNVAHPLYALVEGIMKWAIDNIYAPLVKFAHDLVVPIWHAIDTAVRMLDDIYDFVVNVLRPIWNVGEWLIVWFVQFAVDPAGTADRIGREMMQYLAPLFRDAVLQAVHANEDFMEDLVLRWLD